MSKVLIRLTPQEIRDAGGQSLHVHNYHATECKSCGQNIPRRCGWKWQISGALRFCLCFPCAKAVKPEAMADWTRYDPRLMIFGKQALVTFDGTSSSLDDRTIRAREAKRAERCPDGCAYTVGYEQKTRRCNRCQTFERRA